MTQFLVRPEKTLAKSSTLKNFKVGSPKRVQFGSMKSMSKMHKEQAQILDKVHNNVNYFADK